MSVLGARPLAWLLRRQVNAHPEAPAELVLVRAHPMLAELPGELEVGAARWALAAVGGELSLRAALMEHPRLVAVVPADFDLPLDLAQRALLRRALTLGPRDVVAAAAERPCESITDAALADAVMADAEGFAARAGRWSFRRPVVTEDDLRQILAGLEAPVDRRRPSEMLAEWLVEGPPREGADGLRKLLIERRTVAAALLAEALTPSGLRALVQAGALAGIERVPCPHDRAEARNLVEPAVRAAWRQNPEAVRPLLAEAEARAAQLDLGPDEATRAPLLRAAFDAAIGHHAAALQAGQAPTPDALAPLERALQADAEQIAQVHALARLARFADAPLGEGEDAAGWSRLARGHTAWADRLARRARRRDAQAPEPLRAAARAVLARYLARRDALNRAFATWLAGAEVGAYGRGGLTDGMPLHLLTRTLVAPLAQDDARVLLVVLDGCDLSTFHAVLDALSDVAAPRLPAARGALRGALEATGAVFGALAPLPTVTSVARRALFAGDVPQNAALRDCEADAANSSGDHVAFKRNAALGDVPRTLLLKGELGDDAQPLVDAIEGGAHRVVAAVFNAVDDALSSKEVTPLGPWTRAALGPGLARAVAAAVARGFVVVMTADHGHTPYWSADRKVPAKRGEGPRFARSALPGATRFGPVPWRAETLHLLTDVGAFAGNQHRGFHGGAGLEEVVVPVALLGAPGAGSDTPERPFWWDDSAPPAARPTGEGLAAALMRSPRLIERSRRVRVRVKDGVIGDLIEALDHAAGRLSLERTAELLGTSPKRAGGLVHELKRLLNVDGAPVIDVDEAEDAVRLDVAALRTQFGLPG